MEVVLEKIEVQREMNQESFTLNLLSIKNEKRAKKLQKSSIKQVILKFRFYSPPHFHSKIQFINTLRRHMKLYYSPGVCSLSPHIVALEAGLNISIEKVDLKTKKTESGLNFSNLSEKGYVPHLVLDNGEALTEGVAMVQYLADLSPNSNLLPKAGSFERVRVQEWLNYIATEVHKSHSPLFNPATGPMAAEVYMEKLKKAYTFISGKLEGKKFLMGDQFTVADAYLFTVLGWASHIKLDLGAWPLIVEYKARVAARPKVKEAMLAEGLLK
jgi:glutathione S-transferase